MLYLSLDRRLIFLTARCKFPIIAISALIFRNRFYLNYYNEGDVCRFKRAFPVSVVSRSMLKTTLDMKTLLALCKSLISKLYLRIAN
jgi:hypothetical protein